MVTDNSYSSHALSVVKGYSYTSVVMGLQLYLCGDGATAISTAACISVVMGVQLYLCGDGATAISTAACISVVMGVQLYLCGDGLQLTFSVVMGYSYISLW